MTKPFYEVITEAVADMLDNGFISIHQLDNWLAQIRLSAKDSLVPEYEVEKSITNNMKGIYERLVEKKQILQYHPDLKLFTLDNVKPKLRKELDKAILTNAKLVKLNRERVINQTLQRFSGWATSIPVGGSQAVNKVEIKKTIRKQLASLPFEERRVAIDQGHKFIESLNRILAVGNDAIAGIWRSRWRRPGYNYRKEHKERDGKIYAIRDNWAIKARLMKKGRYGFLDEYEQAGEMPFCSCSVQFLYNLTSLPEDMLTEHGKKEIEKALISMETT